MTTERLALFSFLLTASCGGDSAPAPAPVAPDPAPVPAPSPPPPPPSPTPDPAVPINLQVANNGPDFVEWTWDPVPGTTGYEIQASRDIQFSDEDIIISTSETSFRWSMLPADTEVYIRVRSVSGNVRSNWTLVTLGRTMRASIPPPSSALGPPANIRVAAKGSDFVEWEWDWVALAGGYDVQTSRTFEFPGNAPFSTVVLNSFRLTDLPPETDVFIRVRSRRDLDAGPSRWSTPAQGRTEPQGERRPPDQPPPTEVPPPAPPPAPTPTPAPTPPPQPPIRPDPVPECIRAHRSPEQNYEGKWTLNFTNLCDIWVHVLHCQTSDSTETAYCGSKAPRNPYYTHQTFIEPRQRNHDIPYIDASYTVKFAACRWNPGGVDLETVTSDGYYSCRAQTN